MKKNLLAAAFAAVIAGPQSASADSPEAACRAYADFAWKQQRANRDRKCGYHGSRWSFDTKHHYNWCLSATMSQRRAEQDARKNALKSCAPDWCETYAKRALKQQFENQTLGCGFGGDRWSINYEHHYNWCKRNRDGAGREWQARNVAMNRCKAERGR